MSGNRINYDNTTYIPVSVICCVDSFSKNNARVLTKIIIKTVLKISDKSYYFESKYQAALMLIVKDPQQAMRRKHSRLCITPARVAH
tara:strand:- start:605429 stop:605689 length:261 start_codon:yes stop_codon:yes gene_type:complete